MYNQGHSIMGNFQECNSLSIGLWVPLLGRLFLPVAYSFYENIALGKNTENTKPILIE